MLQNLRMGGAVPLRPLCAFTAQTGKNFPSASYIYGHQISMRWIGHAERIAGTSVVRYEEQSMLGMITYKWEYDASA